MISDVRYAIRALRAAPGFTAMAALTIALGIGANTAIFSVINAVLLRPLPYRDPHRLARLTEGRPDYRLNVSYPNFLDWRARTKVFEEMAICRPVGSAVATGEGRAEVVSTGSTESRLFPLLGVHPVVGRLFTPEEERPGGAPVAVISHRLWQRRFAGATDVVNRHLVLDGQPVSIVGVLPAEFRLVNTDVFFPLVPRLTSGQLNRGNHSGFAAYARLREGVDFERAQQEMSSVAADLERQYPPTNARIGVIVTPLTESLLGDADEMLMLLGGAVALLLLIACANVANVLLARGLGRERETAVRATLGAGRFRIVRLFLCEGLVISLLGSALGLLVAAWGIRAIRAMPGLGLPRSGDVAIDGTTIGYALVLAVVTVVLFALAPAIQLSRVNLMQTLRQAGATASSPGSARRLRWSLLVVEVALSLMLLVGAALMLRTVRSIMAVDPGYDPSGLLMVGLIHPSDRYSEDAPVRQFAERLLEQVRAVPGVANAAIVFPLNLIGYTWNPKITLPDRPFAAGQEPTPLTSSVTETFFETMRIPLKRGRVFGPQDRAGAPMAAIVNDTFVRQVLKGEDPLGRRLSAIGIPQMAEMQIVGVVGDTRRSGLTLRPAPELYVPYAQMPTSDPTIVVRAASGDPLALAKAVDAQVVAIDPDVPTALPRRVADVVQNSTSDRRAIMMLLALFSAVALGLTGLGIAGVVSYAVAQRTQEIGVRMALGADAGDVLRLVLRGAMTPVFVGLVLGAAATVPFSRLIRSFLFQVTPWDPLSLVSSGVLLVGAALVAAYVPARRATRVDPLVALRAQ